MKWDPETLWLKAKVYFDKANEFDHNQSEFPLWSALALELLARAALAHIHPTLNADPTDPNNLLFAIGFEIAGQPRSIPVHAVHLRLEKTVPGFGKVQRELCDYMAFLRNEELHSGELAFEGLKESKWLPRFYEVCKVLCESMGKTLADFTGSEIALSAERLITGQRREIESSVKSKIAAHRKVFSDKTPEDQSSARAIAEARAGLLRAGLTLQDCPACGSKGLLRGELIKELKPRYEDELLLVAQEFLAVAFKCPVCDLAFQSLEEIAHSGIEPRFTQERATELHELFEPEYDGDYMNM